jgi:hypothetical protein
MTPEPTDLLRGARRTLADLVLPALADPFTIEQLKTVLGVLAHLEAVIDEAYPLEAAEADDLRCFLGEAAGSGGPALAPLRAALAAAAIESAAASRLPSYRELRDGNVARKRLVTEVIRALRRDRADSERNPALEAALDELVRRQLARERLWGSGRKSAK